MLRNKSRHIAQSHVKIKQLNNYYRLRSINTRTKSYYNFQDSISAIQKLLCNFSEMQMKRRLLDVAGNLKVETFLRLIVDKFKSVAATSQRLRDLPDLFF